MKHIFIILCAFFLTACNQRSGEIKKILAKIDSLQKQLDESYKPGFGEFMSGIQIRHAKLWFAGQNKNWSLAEFEMHEIQEALDGIQKFCSERPEVKHMGMMSPAIDTVNKAIQQRNPELFKSGFHLFTSTCNNCHKATNHAFNVVTVPINLPVVNQDFKSGK